MRVLPARRLPHARVLLPLRPVRVSGPSMVPTLRTGDLVLARTDRRALRATRAGDVVVARFDDLPATLVVKRVAARSGRGEPVRAELRSDNDAAGGDSRTHGAGLVVGRVRWVLGPGRPRRVGPPPVAPPGL